MINETVTLEVLRFLNELLEVDRYAIHELFAIRVGCTKDLADHSTVQVMGHGEVFPIAPGHFRVGILGILNGLCGTYDDGPRKGWGPISAIYDKGIVQRFDRTPNGDT